MQRVNDKTRALVFPALVLADEIVTAFANAPLAGPAMRPGQELGRQTFAALAAAAIDDGAPAGGGHAHQKTMGAFASCDAGLIGSFH